MQLLQSQSPLDNSPIAALYQQYWLRILNTIRQQIPSRDEAEDVLLEVFLAALESESLLTLSEQQQLAWLRQVARHKCIDYHRRLTRRSVVPLEQATDQLFDADDHSPEQVALRQEEHALLHSHIAALPELQQELLRLRFANGLRCAEIAQIMHKKEGAIRTLLSRTLNLLRTIYDKK